LAYTLLKEVVEIKRAHNSNAVCSATSYDGRFQSAEIDTSLSLRVSPPDQLSGDLPLRRPDIAEAIPSALRINHLMESDFTDKRVVWQQQERQRI
jgi:hypothetical protein